MHIYIFIICIYGIVCGNTSSSHPELLRDMQVVVCLEAQEENRVFLLNRRSVLSLQSVFCTCT